MSFSTNETYANKRMLKSLVSTLLKECKSEDAEFILENIVPTLLPALVSVLEGLEKSEERRSKEESKWTKTEMEYKPLNRLATLLYRNNPRAPGSQNKKLQAHRRLIQDVIVEERKHIQQVAFQRRLRKDTTGELLALGVWPVAQGTNHPEYSISRSSKDLQDFLLNLEWVSGLAGIKSELLVVLEALDVKKTHTATWPGVVEAIAQWAKLNPEKRFAKMSREYRTWLREQLLSNIERSLEDYYCTSSPEELFQRVESESGGAITWRACVAMLEEVRDHVLGWEEKDAEWFAPELVLDTREMKCCDEENISVADFTHVLNDFLQRLVNARTATFSL